MTAAEGEPLTPEELAAAEAAEGTREPAVPAETLLAEAAALEAEAAALMAEDGDYDDGEPFVQPAGMPVDFGTQFGLVPLESDPAVGPYDGFDTTDEGDPA